MLSPLLSGIPDAIETVEHTGCDRVERRRPADAGFPIPLGPSLARRRSKARVRCTWKGCGHQEPDTDKME